MFTSPIQNKKCNNKNFSSLSTNTTPVKALCNDGNLNLQQFLTTSTSTTPTKFKTSLSKLNNLTDHATRSRRLSDSSINGANKPSALLFLKNSTPLMLNSNNNSNNNNKTNKHLFFNSNNNTKNNSKPSTSLLLSNFLSNANTNSSNKNANSNKSIKNYLFQSQFKQEQQKTLSSSIQIKHNNETNINKIIPQQLPSLNKTVVTISEDNNSIKSSTERNINDTVIIRNLGTPPSRSIEEPNDPIAANNISLELEDNNSEKNIVDNNGFILRNPNNKNNNINNYSSNRYSFLSTASTDVDFDIFNLTNTNFQTWNQQRVLSSSTTLNQNNNNVSNNNNTNNNNDNNQQQLKIDSKIEQLENEILNLKLQNLQLIKNLSSNSLQNQTPSIGSNSTSNLTNNIGLENKLRYLEQSIDEYKSILSSFVSNSQNTMNTSNEVNEDCSTRSGSTNLTSIFEQDASTNDNKRDFSKEPTRIRRHRKKKTGFDLHLQIHT